MSSRKPSYTWWWDSHNSPRCSPWLQCTLSELDMKTKAMLDLIEEDADSFAQRAEMYYKKRPEIVNMVEDFYRTHRSLAERYDQLKSEIGSRPSESIFSVKIPIDKASEISNDSYDSEESEVDDPEPEDTQVEEHRGGENSERFYCECRANCDTQVENNKTRGNGDARTDEHKNGSGLAELQIEIERLQEENRLQKLELEERSEEKREVIRQLCLSMEMLKEENASLKKYMRGSKKWSLFEFYKWKGVLSGKLFNRISVFQPSFVAV